MIPRFSFALIVQKLKDAARHPSRFTTALAILATVHVTALGISLHEIWFSITLSLIFLAFSVDSVRLPFHINFVRQLIKGGVNLVTAASFFVQNGIHGLTAALTEAQKSWHFILAIAAITFCADWVSERIREHKSSHPPQPLGRLLLAGTLQGRFEPFLITGENMAARIFVCGSGALYPAEFIAELRNGFGDTIRALKVMGDSAILMTDLPPGEYLIWVQGTRANQPKFRLQAHVIIHDSVRRTIHPNPTPTPARLAVIVIPATTILPSTIPVSDQQDTTPPTETNRNKKDHNNRSQGFDVFE